MTLPRAGAIFTVPPGRPFLEALAAAVLDGALPRIGGAPPSPLDLPAITILLPTRRAARALQEAFLKVGGGTAMLLPAIRPIAESDEDASLIARASAGVFGASVADVSQAMGGLERRLVLTQLVMAWSHALRRGASGEAGLAPVAGAGTPAQAIGLADTLATLMDAIETENVSLDGLATLVPEEHATHWQQTLEFLEIVTQHWPQVLASQQLLSPAQRRNALILDEARRVAERPLSAPVIIAGVTGSVPATAHLMRAVLADPQGAIVLPALDRHLDAESWEVIREGRHEHPQYGFSRLLDNLGVTRADVGDLPGPALTPAQEMRNEVIGQALRPTGTLHQWRTWRQTVDRTRLTDALAGVNLIAAPSSEEEAEAIALVMRHAAETPGRTAALVTPDRVLARRVAVRLSSWGIRVDDSAGRPLRKTMPGAFLDLVAEGVAQNFAPAALMALLEHPLTRLGLGAGAVRRAARQLELAAFRRPYLGQGLEGVEAAVEARARERGPEVDFSAVRDLVARVQAAFGPLHDLVASNERMPLATLARVHAMTAETVAHPADAEPGATSPVWHEEAGEAAAALFANLDDARLPPIAIPARDYADVYRALVAQETVRTRIPVHPRIFIWGPYEARLQQPDIMILGGLVEGTWPAAADPGPWLNRGMRRTLGLPLPEEEIGRAAHDVTTFLGAPTVYLTRAAKVTGTPTVPSRWLQRLDALLGALDMRHALAPSQPWLAWAAARDRAGTRPRVLAPEPRPALAVRPRRASVSDIETWITNPYALYARRILRLEPLPPLGQEPGPQERGLMLHAALSQFAAAHPMDLPDDVAAKLMEFANAVVAEMTGVPRVAAFWLPRLERFAQWFAETEPARRTNVRQVAAEVVGRHVLGSPGRPFELRGRADRIDLTASGAIITDYKTGAVPGQKKVKEGLAPQLPLEAALLMAGAFTGFGKTAVTGLRYIRASGGEPPGEVADVALDAAGIAALVAQVLAGVEALIAAYDDPAKPYRALRRPGFSYDYDDYAHLARVQEWLGSNTSDEEDAP